MKTLLAMLLIVGGCLYAEGLLQLNEPSILTTTEILSIEDVQIADYSHVMSTALGNPLLMHTVENDISPTNTFMDFGLFDGTLRLEVTGYTGLDINGELEARIRDINGYAPSCAWADTPYWMNGSYKAYDLYIEDGDTKTFYIPVHRNNLNCVVDVGFSLLQNEYFDAAWWNTSYSNRIPINCSLVTDGTPIVINGSSGFDISGKNQIVWTQCGVGNLSLYYNLYSDYAVANDTIQYPMEVEKGNGTSFNATMVWASANAVSVWHGGSLTDSTGRNNLSTSGASNSFSSNSSRCTFGNCFQFGDGSSCVRTTTSTGIPYGSSDYTGLTWGWHSNWSGTPSPSILSYGDAVAGLGKWRILYYYALSTLIGDRYGAPVTSMNLSVANATKQEMYSIRIGSNAWIIGYNTTLSGTASYTSTLGASPIVGIGCQPDALSGWGEDTGTLDEVRIYNVSLSNLTINQTYYNAIGTLGYGSLGTPEIFSKFSVNYTSGGIAFTNVSNYTAPVNASLTAIASVGYLFSNWTTNCTGTINETHSPNAWIEITDDNTCFATATFSQYTASMAFSNPQFEGQPDNMTLNISTNLTGLTPSANLVYNGINYVASYVNISEGYLVSARVTPPAVSSNTSVSFTWNLNLTNAYQQVSNSYSNSTIVSAINIFICNTSQAPIVNFTYYSQETPTVNMNASMDANFLITSADGSFGKNISLNFSTAAPYAAICLSASNSTYILTSLQQYYATGYRKLFYYLLGTNVSTSTTTNISLYLIASNASTLAIYNVLELSNQQVPNAYIQIQRYYPSLNQLFTVSMAKTDSNGAAESYILPNDANYRYVVIRDGAVVYTSGVSPFPCDAALLTCTMKLYITQQTPNEYNGYIGNSLVGCSVDFSTSKVYCTSNNPSGTGSDIRLQLWQTGTYQDTLVCDNILSAGSGTVVCDIPDLTKTYKYVGFSTIGSIIVIGNGMFNNATFGICAGSSACSSPSNRVSMFGRETGMLAAIGMIIIFAFLGMMGGFSASIIMATFGIMLSALVGFIDIELGALIAIISTGIILAWILRG